MFSLSLHVCAPGDTYPSSRLQVVFRFSFHLSEFPKLCMDRVFSGYEPRTEDRLICTWIFGRSQSSCRPVGWGTRPELHRPAELGSRVASCPSQHSEQPQRQPRALITSSSNR